MKQKQKVDFIYSLVLILVGVVLMVLPLIKVPSIKVVLIGVMISYIISNIVRFILTRKSKDYDSIFTILSSIVIIILTIILDMNKPLYLALTILVWVVLLSLIKLKKSDYYDDNNDKMWKLRILILILFILTGFLTSINLYYEQEGQILIIGYFFLINGMLEITDPVVKYLIKKQVLYEVIL